jgi:hypothetical protein
LFARLLFRSWSGERRRRLHLGSALRSDEFSGVHVRSDGARRKVQGLSHDPIRPLSFTLRTAHTERLRLFRLLRAPRQRRRIRVGRCARMQLLHRRRAFEMPPMHTERSMPEPAGVVRTRTRSEDIARSLRRSADLSCRRAALWAPLPRPLPQRSLLSHRLLCNQVIDKVSACLS